MTEAKKTASELIEAGRIGSEQILAKIEIEDSTVPIKELLTEQAGSEFGKFISLNERFGHTVQRHPTHFDAEKHSFETFAFSREQLEELLNKVVEESKDHPGQSLQLKGSKG